MSILSFSFDKGTSSPSSLNPYCALGVFLVQGEFKLAHYRREDAGDRSGGGEGGGRVRGIGVGSKIPWHEENSSGPSRVLGMRVWPRSKLSNRQLNQLVDFFAVEVAVKAARVLWIHRHSAERAYHVIRQRVALECERRSPLGGEIEADESYFVGYRKGQRGRGAAGEVAGFGLLKRWGQVYTRPVSNVTREMLRAVIHQNAPRGSPID